MLYYIAYAIAALILFSPLWVPILLIIMAL